MTLSRLVSQASSPAGCPLARRKAGAHARSVQRSLVEDRRSRAAHEFREWPLANKATWSEHKQEPEPRRLSSAGGVPSAAPRSTHCHRLAASFPPCRNSAAPDFRPTPHVVPFGRYPHLAARSIRSFSGSAPARATMAATKIDGTAIAKKIRERLRAEIAQVKETNPRFQPTLKIIQGSYESPVARTE